jgi:hypothetical protein
MSTLAYAVNDSVTMLRRSLKRIGRYPSLTLQLVGVPIIFLLLFVYVFGGTMGAGLGPASGAEPSMSTTLSRGSSSWPSPVWCRERP